ncbi:conserved hypothetical protein [Roseibium sp. TrichSKD4]|nr:conserved hypothetical protein [Roseibium sp. TrichSKD4]
MFIADTFLRNGSKPTILVSAVAGNSGENGRKASHIWQKTANLVAYSKEKPRKNRGSPCSVD